MLFFDSVDFSFLCVVFSFLLRNGEVWEDGEKYKERNPQMGHRVSLCIRVLRFGFSMLFLDMVSSFKTSETSPRLPLLTGVEHECIPGQTRLADTSHGGLSQHPVSQTEVPNNDPRAKTSVPCETFYSRGRKFY